MPVIGLNFQSMEAKRGKAGTAGEIKVNSTPKINNITEVSIPTLKKKALSFNFEFVTRYEPDIGEIKITGELLFLAQSNATILNRWKTKKSIKEEVSVEILNHLFRRCLLKVSNIADDLQLPPPVQIPRVRPKTEGSDYIG